MSEQPIIQQLQSLKLTGMAQAFIEQQEQPSLQDLSFVERLALLVDRETLSRANRRIANLLKHAKLRQHATSEHIDYQHPRGLAKSQFASLISCAFITQRHNLQAPQAVGKAS